MATYGQGEVSIGRGSRNDLILDDPTVSQFHALMVMRGQSVWLLDQGSSNGTYVNSQKIGERQLSAGDIIHFGKVRLEFDGSQLRPIEASSTESRVDPNASGSSWGKPQRTLLAVSLLGILIAGFGFRMLFGGVSTTQIARATVQIVMADSNGSDCWSGSGVLISEGGYVATNAHVAAVSDSDGPEYSDCTRLSVGLSDDSGMEIERFVTGTVVISDEESDLAIVQLNESSEIVNRRSLEFRRSDPFLEQPIRVFGYPAVGGETLTVSSGIVSGIDRSSGISFLKVTADISGGSSGGPVVDADGKLLGISTAIRRQGIDCSNEAQCFSEGNSLGLVRPVSLLESLLRKVR